MTSKKRSLILDILRREEAYPTIMLVICLLSLSIHGLASYARAVEPDLEAGLDMWQASYRMFMTVMLGLSVHDLIRIRRKRKAVRDMASDNLDKEN